MPILHIDIETYSSTDLKKSGVYRYVEAPDFKILLIGYAVDNGPIEVIMPGPLYNFKYETDLFANKLLDPEYIKTSHNANFERVCLSKYFGLDLPIDQWRCTMSHAAMLGLPLSLDACAKALHFESGKTSTGKSLINYFTKPCKPTKTNGGRTRNRPADAPEKWNEFIEYCRQDVELERQISNKISFFNPTKTEEKLWILDQKINDRGVMIDKDLVKTVIKIDQAYREKLINEAVALTGLENPNSLPQLKKWLADEGLEVENLQKQNIPDILKGCYPEEKTAQALKIRQKLSKTSIKKYQTMLAGVGSDDRFRGLLQYYGANRTGRWAGRLVQIQNLPRISMEDIDLARD